MDSKEHIPMWWGLVYVVWSAFLATVQTVVILKALGVIQWGWWLLVVMIMGTPVAIVLGWALLIVFVMVLGVILVWLGERVGTAAKKVHEAGEKIEQMAGDETVH